MKAVTYREKQGMMMRHVIITPISNHSLKNRRFRWAILVTTLFKYVNFHDMVSDEISNPVALRNLKYG